MYKGMCFCDDKVALAVGFTVLAGVEQWGGGNTQQAESYQVLEGTLMQNTLLSC